MPINFGAVTFFRNFCSLNVLSETRAIFYSNRSIEIDLYKTDLYFLTDFFCFEPFKVEYKCSYME